LYLIEKYRGVDIVLVVDGYGIKRVFNVYHVFCFLVSDNRLTYFDEKRMGGREVSGMVGVISSTDR